MKLKEILAGEAAEDAFYDWLDDNLQPWIGSIHKPHLDYEDGKVRVGASHRSDFSRASIIFKNKSRWNPPVESNNWNTADIRDIYLEQYSMQNFDKVPNVEFISLKNVMLDSFRGVEKLTNLEHFRMESPLSKSLPKNILRLYKNTSLQVVDLDGVYPAKLIEIFDKHFDERDITEAIDEMIEQGYKEYAKL